MKKLFVILVTILAITLMGFTAFASNGDSDRVDNNTQTYAAGNEEGKDSIPKDDNAAPARSDDNDGVGYDVLLEDYRQLLDEVRDNVELRHAIMKKIVDLKKLNGDDSICAFIDGKEVEFDVPPVIKSNRTLIPVRAVTTALGAEVDWDPANPDIIEITKTFVDDNGNDVLKVIVINLDSGKVTINGAAAELDVPPTLVDNRTMVPIRFIAETFNMNIHWDKEVGGIVINR